MNTNGIRCGNTKAHGTHLRSYHATTQEVRECYLWTEYEAKCEAAQEAYADSDYEETEARVWVGDDEDGSLSYARMLERKAESGSWWGYGE